MDLNKYVTEIEKARKSSRSEAKLEGALNNIIKSCLAEFGVDFDPHVNETLKSIGLSQIDSKRPDGVFGHIVYDYKSASSLSNPTVLKKSKEQIVDYLNSITGGHDHSKENCAKWFGYLCDAEAIAYCRSDGSDWRWSRNIPITESSLHFLVHVYRSLSRKPLTSRLLSSSFGKDSDTAVELIRVMCAHLSKPKHRTHMLFREWKRLFQQVSTYGLDQLPGLKSWAKSNGIATKDASQILFAMHSYYSLVVKILTSELLTITKNDTHSICETIIGIKKSEDLFSYLEKIENNEFYKKYRISNFLEGDFFSWYVNEKSKPLANAIKAVAREFLDFEPASAILLPHAVQDLLKEFYSSLVDEQIRHDLGEYYTPDWLAQHLLDRAGYKGDIDKSVLDPACGSGTFIVEAITRLKKECIDKGFSPLDTLLTILRNIKGLDLNPLAVISARANYILSIYDLVFQLGHDIEIPIYLADAINVPVEREDSNGSKYLEYLLDTEIDLFRIEIPLNIVETGNLGQSLSLCEECIVHGKSADYFIAKLKTNKSINKLLDDITVSRLHTFYSLIESLEKRDWDKIWCRIIKNNFSPRGFSKFDFIVGNPPWVRWSRLPETYRNRVKGFCNYYGLVSGRGYTGGIESDISTVITYSTADNLLSDNGIIAYLITWTVFKSSSARGFRLGYLPDKKGLKVCEIGDLTRLQPFQDASNQTAIYIARKVSTYKKSEFKSTPCYIWFPKERISRVPSSWSLDQVYTSFDILPGAACSVGEWGSPLFTGDINHYKDSVFLKGSSSYLQNAHRGTVTDCARVFWVKVLKYSKETNRALIRTLTKEELPGAREVEPVDGAWIEADLLYPLMRGRDLGRFCYNTSDWYQIIPNQHYENVDSEDVFADKYPLTYSYFKNYESILSNRSTYKRYQKHLPFYVIYCVGDYSFSPYKVVWMEQQNPSSFRTCVISNHDRSIVPNSVIVPDHKLYFASFDNEQEAHYVCGFLNSYSVRTWLGGFLLGKQIGTSIFEYMQLPPFNSSNESCTEISTISMESHNTRNGSSDSSLLGDIHEERLHDLVKNLF